MMVKERILPDEDAAGTHAGGATETRRVRRRVRRKRPSQVKFSPPVRAALWLGLPALLWAGVYFLGRALLP